jgi:3-keto-5-aminohexanoate cleavage enzyme
VTALLVTAAVNGAEVTRAQTPYLPITPAEVAEEARRCRDAGASVIHLHGRNEDGTATQSPDVFRAYLEAIRAQTDVIVQFSTGGAIGMEVEERIAALALRPEMATLTTGTCNFGDEVFMNSLPVIRAIADRMRTFDIVPEIEVFDVGMLDTAVRLVREGVFEGPLHVDFVLGVPGALAADLEHLDYLISRLPSGWTFSVAGIGRHQLAMAEHAMERGGHVRVGLEDNIWRSRGELARGSFELVEIAVEIGRRIGREPMADAEARAFLGVRALQSEKV